MMFVNKLLPSEFTLPIMKFRKIGAAFSVLMIIATMGLIAVKGLNLGIDFLGGSLIEVKTNGADIGDLRDRLGQLDIGEVSLQEFGAADDILIRVQNQAGASKDDALNIAAIDAVKEAIDEVVLEYRRTEFVGPTIGQELRQAAIWATIASILAIMIYVWFRFEWQFSVAAAVALFHDVIITMGFLSLTGIEFNLATVAAILTIAGYSINDTVVIFDRVRDNLRKYKKLDLIGLLDKSLNGTLSRTLLTSITTLIALLALGILGGEVIRGFAITLIFGVIIGTYSSLYIAAPLLNIIKPDRANSE